MFIVFVPKDGFTPRRDRGVEWAIRDTDSIRDHVARLRALHPDLDRDGLAGLVIKRHKWRACLWGGAMGLGGCWTLAPDVIWAGRRHYRLALAIACIYCRDPETTVRTEDLALGIAAVAVAERLKRFLGQAGMAGARRLLRSGPARTAIRCLPARLITIAGARSLLNVARIVPVAGGVISAAADYYSAICLGAALKTHYQQSLFA